MTSKPCPTSESETATPVKSKNKISLKGEVSLVESDEVDDTYLDRFIINDLEHINGTSNKTSLQ